MLRMRRGKESIGKEDWKNRRGRKMNERKRKKEEKRRTEEKSIV